MGDRISINRFHDYLFGMVFPFSPLEIFGTTRLPRLVVDEMVILHCKHVQINMLPCMEGVK